MERGREDLLQRTKKFAIGVIRLLQALPETTEAQIIGERIVQSGTSVGAQYREACRAKSDAEFITKLEDTLQELDETSYWLELLVESGIATELHHVEPLTQENTELTAIFVTIVRKVRQNRS